MITRNHLFNEFKRQNAYLSDADLQMIFLSISDEKLAESFNLSVMRKGYFTLKN